MSSQRRRVRVTDQFFERLDELLPAERTIDGRPSATDFLLHDLPTMIDRLADDYIACTLPVEELAPVRVMITSGLLVPYLSLYVTLTIEDVIEVLYLDIGPN
ncbi:MAG: hypothetical protein R2699_17870 [Acidimicrobiales bacterium]|nr:hypothetical protein [Acidimicrobiales bacterium]MCB1259235.1 hypothetical protein [Acidimicrobiales bacterium]